MKNRKWAGLKAGIIMYLAISKIFYWQNMIVELLQSDLENAWSLVLDRLLTQDLPLILVIACLVVIDMSKGKIHIKLAIGYVAYIGILFVYAVALQWIFQNNPMEGVLFFRDSFVAFTIQFAIIGVILEIKEHFMKKVSDTPEADEASRTYE